MENANYEKSDFKTRPNHFTSAAKSTRTMFIAGLPHRGFAAENVWTVRCAKSWPEDNLLQ